MVIEFKRFMYSNKKIDTLRDYVTFFTGVETGKVRMKKSLKIERHKRYN